MNLLRKLSPVNGSENSFEFEWPGNTSQSLEELSSSFTIIKDFDLDLSG